MKSDYKSVYRYVAALPVYSDHEHHADDHYFSEQPYTLERAFGSSSAFHTHRYVLDGTRASRERYLDAMRHNAHFLWFERGVQALHGFRTPLSADNWDRISAGMTRRYAAEPDFHWHCLRDAGYERIVQDCYWNPGTDGGHPELFVPAFRIDDFLCGFHAEVPGPQKYRCWTHFGFTGRSLADFVEFFRETIKSRHRRGKVVVFKCAEAYNRTLDFQPDDESAARRVFGRHPSRVNQDGRRLFSNYMFNRACELARELRIPIQLHTGTAQLPGSKPLNLLATILKYPDVNFVLLHMGFFWQHEAAGLTYLYRNAWPNLTCCPTMATTATIRQLHDYLDVSRDVNTITWGSDCWVPEESVGALLAWRHVVATVLAERLASGLLRTGDADRLAEKLMFRNARQIYGSTRSM